MRITATALRRLTSFITGKGTLMVSALFFVLLVTGVASTFLYARDAHAAVNSTINFQARVLQANGAVVPDGSLSVEFKVYDAASGGTNEWTETQSLSAKNGYITASLGSVTPFGTSIDWSQEHWITMNINGDGEMGPTRMKITAVPYAFRSGQADALTNGSGTIAASQLAQLAPGSIQGVSSSNTALRINQTGAGNLLQLQSGGVDELTVANNGDTSIGGELTVTGGITVGNSSSTTAGTIRWTGTVFEGYNGSAWTSLGGSALGNPIINKVKLVSEVQNSTVNATATLQNDDELFFAVGANETWTFRFMVQGNANATPDFKFAVTAPGGATCNVSTADHEAAVSVANLACGVSTGLVTGNTANDLYEIVGTVRNGATAGTVQLQWAQNTANAANSTVLAGSSVLATRAVGANGTAQAFIQNGNSFGADAFLGTNDNQALNFITNGTTKLTVLANGNVGVGDATPAALFTVGSGDALQVDASGNLGTTGTLRVDGLTTLNGNLVAGGVATGTTGTTAAPAQVNTTNVTLTAAGAFANNDVIFIDNAGQDYYTRIVSGAGTVNLVVSPSVSYDVGAAVTKYTVQNIGATDSDYTTQANRFFQGYFLGGIVVGAGSTTISDGLISRTTGDIELKPGTGGSLVVDGTLTATTINATTITGDASGLTNIDASQISGGTVSDTALSANVTLQGNTFNGISQLVQLDGAGALPALNGAALTTLNGSNISSGTLADARLSANVTLAGNTFNAANSLLQLDAGGKVSDSLLSTNITALGNTFNGNSQLVQLTAGGLLPVLSGTNLTSLNGSNISTGIVSDARLSTNVTLAGNTFNGANGLVQLDGTGKLPALDGSNLTNINGAALTGLNGSNISSGTVADARLTTNVTLLGNTFNGNNQLVQLSGSGALPALNGSALTTLNGSNISSGTIADARLSGNVTVAGNTFNAANTLLQLDAGGKVSDSLLSTNVTAQGNTFNGNSQLVQLTAGGLLPVLSGANLTSLNGSNISSGTVADARLSANVTLAGNTFNAANSLLQLDAGGKVSDSLLSTNITALGNTFNGNSQLVQLTAGGLLPVLSGANLTSLNGSNISSGTVADARLSTNVTLSGNTFNGANGLVQLDGSGNLPALNGSALTTLNGSNISSGTVADARLTTNVTLAGNTFNGVSQLVRLDGAGALPALNGGALTTLNATNVSSGTVADARLSSNVGLLNLSQTYTAAKTFAANIALGTDSGSPTAGLLTLNDATASNGFTSVLGTNALTANRAINLPDEAGTICLANSNNCGYVRFGQASAQVDTSTNPSLFINKTGVSGNMLTLQKNGTTVLSILNTGALQVQLTDTSAFAVKDAGGADDFSVDTNAALVRIGSATADANATLLVLDTKNTAGDPTGVNGGSYYNSSTNKFRCYQNGLWQDCLPAGYIDYSLMAQNLTYTNAPAADTEFVGTPRKLIDLTNANQFRLVISRPAGTVTAGHDCRLQYALTEAGTWTNLDGGTGPEVDISGTAGVKNSPWTALAAGAKGDRYIRVMCKQGNGTNDPQFRGISVQIR